MTLAMTPNKGEKACCSLYIYIFHGNKLPVSTVKQWCIAMPCHISLNVCVHDLMYLCILKKEDLTKILNDLVSLKQTLATKHSIHCTYTI